MCPVLVSCFASPVLHRFSTLSHKRHDFRNKCFEYTKCVLILSTTSPWKIDHSKNKWGDARWRSWFRHCATSRKFAGSIPDGAVGIFYWHNPSGRTKTLGSTQPLTEMTTRNISWRLRRLVLRADNLTTSMCRLSWNFRASISWNTQGLSRPVVGLLYVLPLTKKN